MLLAASAVTAAACGAAAGPIANQQLYLLPRNTVPLLQCGCCCNRAAAAAAGGIGHGAATATSATAAAFGAKPLRICMCCAVVL